RRLHPRPAAQSECSARAPESGVDTWREGHPRGRSVSNHHQYTSEVPVIRLGSRSAGIERISGVVGGLGLLLCVAGFFANKAEFFQSYMFAFIYWSGFALGGLGVLLMNNVVGGKWGVTIRRLLEAKMRTIP